MAVHELGPDGNKREKLLEIIVQKGELLSLLLRISSPCLNRHGPETTDVNRKVFKCPLIELHPYRDILRLLLEKPSLRDKVVDALFPELSLTTELETGITELLGLCDSSERDRNTARGVALFDDLPTLFPPGTLLIGPGEAGTEQVVEVSSCDMASEACAVEGWHFRWEGKAFSRTSCRFVIDRYSGTRPIDGFPYRPLIGLDAVRCVGRLQQLIERNRANLGILRDVSEEVDFGDYPVCGLSPRPLMGTEYRVRVGRSF